jgi:drug/metabolite transporter (DMT)-like permease
MAAQPDSKDHEKVINTSIVIMAVVMWGLSFPALKIALEYWPPIMLGALRYFLGSLPILIFLAYRNELKNSMKFSKEDWKFIIGLGIFMVTIPNITQNIGLLYTTASLTSIIQSIGPVLTVILAVFILREALTIYKILGTTLAFICSILLVYEGGVSIENASIFGNVLIFICGLSYGVSGLIGKMALDKVKPLALVGFSMLIGSLVLVPMSLVSEPLTWVSEQNNYSILILILLAIFPCFLATLFWYIALEHIPVSKQVVYVYLVPMVASVFSIAYLDETLTEMAILLGTLTIVGVAIAQYEAKKAINAKSPKS